MRKHAFVTANVLPGHLNAMVKNALQQMGIMDAVEAVRRINSGEWRISRSECPWYENNGVIYYSVTSTGITGPEWATWFRQKGIHLDEEDRSVLLSPDFQPTTGVTTMVAVMRGMLFEDKDRQTRNIHAESRNRNMRRLHAEVACLSMEMFGARDIGAMGLKGITFMHKPIKDSKGNPSLLRLQKDVIRPFKASYGCRDGVWHRADGFAYGTLEFTS